MENQLVRKRRYFSNIEKKEILSEHIDIGVPLSVVARKHNIHPVTLATWKRKMNTPTVDYQEIMKENNKLKAQIKKLQQAHSEAIIDIQDLKDVNQFLKKKWIEQQLNSQQSTKKKGKSPSKK